MAIINEIGRFGNSIEGKKPSDMAEFIPIKLINSCVGIFWHIGNDRFLIGKANVIDDIQADVTDGDVDLPEGSFIIDYNKFHKEIWETKILPDFPEWKNEGYSYSHFSRGRIIYDLTTEKFWIYVPRKNFLHNAALFIANELNIPLGGFKILEKVYAPKGDLETLSMGPYQSITF